MKNKKGVKLGRHQLAEEITMFIDGCSDDDIGWIHFKNWFEDKLKKEVE